MSCGLLSLRWHLAALSNAAPASFQFFATLNWFAAFLYILACSYLASRAHEEGADGEGGELLVGLRDEVARLVLLRHGAHAPTAARAC